jgi:hypothetical protein
MRRRNAPVFRCRQTLLMDVASSAPKRNPNWPWRSSRSGFANRP